MKKSKAIFTVIIIPNPASIEIVILFFDKMMAYIIFIRLLLIIA